MADDSCTCKGIRTCLSCERAAAVSDRAVDRFVLARTLLAQRTVAFDYCLLCRRCRIDRQRLPIDIESRAIERTVGSHTELAVASEDGTDVFCVVEEEATSDAPGPADDRADAYLKSALIASRFQGVSVIEEFISAETERLVLSDFSTREWRPSQSGRRKLDFGPVVNFKRQKVKLGNFEGLPKVCAPIVALMESDSKVSGEGAPLHDFVPIECGVIEYDPAMGASIDRHRFGVAAIQICALSLVERLAPIHKTPPEPGTMRGCGASGSPRSRSRPPPS